MMRHRVDWGTTLQAIRDGAHPMHHPMSDQMRMVYQEFVSFQCDASSKLLRGLADACYANGLDLLLYPGNLPGIVSPRVFPREEYTLDALKHPAIVWEVSSWDTVSPEWIAENAANATGRWMMSMQQNVSANIQSPGERLKWRLDARDATGKAPEGVSFWSDWRSGNEDAQRSYLQDVASVLI